MRRLERPDLAQLTTMRVGGRARAQILLESEEDVARVAEEFAGERFFCLGRGSNILAADGDLDLTLLTPAFGRKIRSREAEDFVYVTADADASLAALLRYCLRERLSGLEGLAGIPGSLGGAIAMNAGSFGTETGARLVQVRVASPAGPLVLGPEQINPTYRRMEFAIWPEGGIIASGTFALTHAPKNDIFQNMRLNFLRKKSSQPVTAHSAGCAFRNPQPGAPAGKLLDECGLKGFRIGGMAFSQKHANFMVNMGGGTFADAVRLMDLAIHKVRARFGLTLEPEVRILQ